jgi:hypothetical protein
MRLELFTLCDYARGEPNGKLYVIGTFDHLFVPQVPVPLPMCAIAARLRFEADETGQKQLSITFVDSDGGKLIPDLTMQMNVQVAPGESTVTANVVVMLPQITLPRYGEYAIDLIVASKSEGSVPLYVQRPGQAPPWQTMTRP